VERRIENVDHEILNSTFDTTFWYHFDTTFWHQKTAAILTGIVAVKNA
jgi:hypothetical protein